MTNEQPAAKDAQKGPGEQILPREDQDGCELDSLRGGADPSGGQSSEVPRDNGRGNRGSFGGKSAERDSSPLSTPSEGSPFERPTEDDLADQEAREGDRR